MNNYLDTLLIVVFSVATVILIALFGADPDSYELVLIGIVVCTLAGILFIKFFSGRGIRKER